MGTLADPPAAGIAGTASPQGSPAEIWQFTGGNWVDVTSTLNVATKTVSTTSRTAFSQFAVTVKLPLPAGTVITLR
jgi:hypothetical protein